MFSPVRGVGASRVHIRALYRVSVRTDMPRFPYYSCTRLCSLTKLGTFARSQSCLYAPVFAMQTGSRMFSTFGDAMKAFDKKPDSKEEKERQKSRDQQFKEEMELTPLGKNVVLVLMLLPVLDILYRTVVIPPDSPLVDWFPDLFKKQVDARKEIELSRKSQPQFQQTVIMGEDGNVQMRNVDTNVDPATVVHPIPLRKSASPSHENATIEKPTLVIQSQPSYLSTQLLVSSPIGQMQQPVTSKGAAVTVKGAIHSNKATTTALAPATDMTGQSSLAVDTPVRLSSEIQLALSVIGAGALTTGLYYLTSGRKDNNGKD